jgi:hypothetical protein
MDFEMAVVSNETQAICFRAARVQVDAFELTVMNVGNGKTSSIRTLDAIARLSAPTSVAA